LLSVGALVVKCAGGRGSRGELFQVEGGSPLSILPCGFGGLIAIVVDGWGELGLLMRGTALQCMAASVGLRARQAAQTERSGVRRLCGFFFAEQRLPTARNESVTK